MPFEVSESASALASGVWMKKPSGPTAVTTLLLVVTIWPAYGEAAPLPWIWKISATDGVVVGDRPDALALADGDGAGLTRSRG